MDPHRIIKVLNFINNFDPFYFEKHQSQKNYGKGRRGAKLLNYVILLLATRALSMFVLICCPHIDKSRWLIKIWMISFSEMNILVPLFLLSGPSFIIFAYGILPRLIERSAIVVDPAPIKYFLEPESEIARSDEKIATIINQLVNSVEQKKSNLVTQVGELCCQARLKTDDGSIWKGIECYKSQLIELKGDQIAFRPQTCSFRYLPRYRAKVKLYVNYLVVCCFMIGSMFIATATWIMIDDKCRSLNLTSSCDLPIVFTPLEQFKVAELSLMTYLCNINFIYTLIMMSLSFDHALKQISDFRKDLSHCLDYLYYFNSRLFPVEEKHLFKIVQEAIIKTRVFDDNIKKGARLLSLLIALFIICGLEVCSGILIGVVVAKRSKESHMIDLMMTIVGFSVAWLVFNIPAVINAYTNARITNTLKLYWPIRAELLHYLIRKSASGSNMSYLMSQWIDLEQYWFEGKADQYIARPLGLDLTYHSVIEANFYVVSTIAFLFR